MTTILDYIYESESSLLNILANVNTITKDFVDFFKKQTIDEIVIVGSGTSCHAGRVVKPLFEKLLNIRTSALYPNEFMEQISFYPSNTLVIGISQSGASASTYHALEKAKENNLFTMSMTSFPQSKITNNVDFNILLDCGEEKAVAKTKGYNATLLTLYLLVIESAYEVFGLDEQAYLTLKEKLNKTTKNLPLVIENSKKWYNENGKNLEKAESLIVIGSSKEIGTIQETTLKLIETVRIPVMGYELEEFMHGIYNTITANSYIIYLAVEDEYFDRMMDLKKYLARKTNYQFMIMSNKEKSEENDFVIQPESNVFHPLEYIIPIQMLCHYLPISKGINPFISGDPNFHNALKSKDL